MRYKRHMKVMDYVQAPGSGLRRVVPETRMPPGDGDDCRRELAEVAAKSNPYVQKYRASSLPQEKVDLLQDALVTENRLRGMFAQERHNPELDDKYINLIPVHNCQDMFECRELSEQEQAVPKVFPLLTRRTGMAVNSRSEFLQNFEIFTEGLLRGLNWDNVFAAGGSVLAALLPLPQNRRDTRQSRRQYFHHEAYTASDIDLFIYGLDEKQANEKLKEVYFTICDSFPDPTVQPICFRTKHAVTIVSKFPYRHIQVVLRLYKSPSEVLAGFDVDSCSVGFDGVNVWMTPRCHNSVTAQYNTVDMTRRSPTYEVRLAKYAARGVEVAVPGLNRRQIDPQIFEIPFEKTRGLMKLLLLEKLNTPELRLQYKQQQRVGRLQPLMVRQGRFYNRVQMDMQQDIFLRAQVDDAPGDVSDYQTVFLPWGPKWDADKVRNLVYTKDMLLNSTFLDPFHSTFRHPCFFGTAEEVLQDCAGDASKGGRGGASPPEDEDQVIGSDWLVRGPLKWLDVDPGQQTVGSFHPITTGEWAEGVHLSGSTEQLIAISQDRSLSEEAALAAVAAIEPPVDSATMNARDAAGRTPLMLAVLAGNAAATAAFLAHGAQLNARLGDGRSALHLAAQYGRIATIPPMLARGDALNALLGDHLEKLEREERALAQQQLKEDEQLQELQETEGRASYFRALHVLKRKRAQEAARRSLERESQGYLDKLDLDAMDYDQRMTPLMYAAFFGHLDCVLALLDARADASRVLTYEENGTVASRHSILTLACHNGHADVVRLLLQRKAPPMERDLLQRTPLHYAALWGETDCVRALLDKSTASSSSAADDAAPAESEGPEVALVDPDVLDSQNRSALLLAVEQGHLQVVELLLGHNNRPGALAALQWTLPPVLVAVQAKQSEVLVTLLQFKGDPNTKVAATGGTSAPVPFNSGFGFQSMRFPQVAQSKWGVASSSNSSSTRTVLDWAEEALAEAERKLAEENEDDTEEKSKQPHISASEYYDFLLSRTPGGFERFALEELKARMLRVLEDDQADGAEDGDEKTNSWFFKQRAKAKMVAGMAAATTDLSTEQTVEKLKEIVAALQRFGAKRAAELEQSEEAARAKAEPLKSRRDKLAGRKASPPSRAPRLQQKATAASTSAFELGVKLSAESTNQSVPKAKDCALSNAMAGLSLSYTERFEPLKAPTGPLFSLDSKVREPRMQARYKALFDAVVADDCATVLSLCGGVLSGSATGVLDAEEPLIVSVKSTLLSCTLLEVAVLRDSAEMVRCLLRLAARQYTPEKQQDDDLPMGEQILLKDQHLMQLGAQNSTFSDFMSSSKAQLEQLQDQQAFKRKGHRMLERLEQYKAEAAAEAAAQGSAASDVAEEDEKPLISVCSVQYYVSPVTGGQQTWGSPSSASTSPGALALGVQLRRYAAVEALLSELDALDILAEDEVAKKVGEPPPRVSSLLLRSRLTFQGPHFWNIRFPLSPFEAAVAADDVRMAELLLACGARDCLRGEDSEALQPLYTGLKVDGEKREDLALPRQLVLSREQVLRNRLRSLHVAAAAGSEAAIEFLLEGGLDSFAVVGDDGEEAATGSLFTVEDRDAQRQLPLHWAVQHNQAGALRRLLNIGRAQMGDGLARLLDDAGNVLTPFPLPLHQAVSLGRCECARLLLEHKAGVGAVDPQKGSALHVAVALGEEGDKARARKAQLLNLLLDAAAAAGQQLLAWLLLQPDPRQLTSLHLAVTYQSKLALEALLSRLGGLETTSRQAILAAANPSGQSALHVAAQHTGPHRLEAVRALLEARADPSLEDHSGATPLHLAARARAGAEVLRLLLPPGAELGEAAGAEDAQGRTPLEWYMVSQLQKLPKKGWEQESRDTEALRLLSTAEAGGRRVVDPDKVRIHSQHSAAVAAAAVNPPEVAFTRSAQPFMTPSLGGPLQGLAAPSSFGACSASLASSPFPAVGHPLQQLLQQQPQPQQQQQQLLGAFFSGVQQPASLSGLGVPGLASSPFMGAPTPSGFSFPASSSSLPGVGAAGFTTPAAMPLFGQASVAAEGLFAQASSTFATSAAPMPTFKARPARVEDEEDDSEDDE